MLHVGKENSMQPEVKSYRLQAEKETGSILVYVFPSECWFSSSVWWFFWQFAHFCVTVHSPAWGSSSSWPVVSREGKDELLMGRGAGARPLAWALSAACRRVMCLSCSIVLPDFLNFTKNLTPLKGVPGLTLSSSNPSIYWITSNYYSWIMFHICRVNYVAWELLLPMSVKYFNIMDYVNPNYRH